jgi:hypothetical protein
MPRTRRKTALVTATEFPRILPLAGRPRQAIGHVALEIVLERPDPHFNPLVGNRWEWRFIDDEKVNIMNETKG